MNNELFCQPYDHADPHWIVKAYFDRMYGDGEFIEAISLLSRRGALNTDGAYCHFPDMNSYFEEDHFEGVLFIYGYSASNDDEDEEVIVSEEVCYQYVRLACEIYLRLHPEDTDIINDLLRKMPVQ